jgi:hypothetical protein
VQSPVLRIGRCESSPLPAEACRGLSFALKGPQQRSGRDEHLYYAVAHWRCWLGIGWIAATEGPRVWEDFRCAYAPPPQRSLSAEEFEHGVDSDDGWPNYGHNLDATCFPRRAQHALIPPLGLLAVGLSVAWIWRGLQTALAAAKKGPWGSPDRIIMAETESAKLLFSGVRHCSKIAMIGNT